MSSNARFLILNDTFLGGFMKKILKWTGIVVFVLIVIMIVFAFMGKDETLNLQIANVDLSKVPDGSYVGKYECFRWSNTVEVNISKHLITSIRPILIQSGRDQLVNELNKSIINEQKIDVDVVTGASASCKGYLKAVELAFKQK